MKSLNPIITILFLFIIPISLTSQSRSGKTTSVGILKEKHELLGISIDEGTALVVQGDQCKVMGRSYVLIYDGSFWSREGWNLKELPDNNKLFYFLRQGDEYDLKKRKVIK